MTDKKTPPLHDESGRFAKGNKGGPGRPKSPDRRLKIEEYRAMVASRMPEILQPLVDKAVAGNMVTARILFDRIWPAQTETVLYLQAQVDELKQLLVSATARQAA